MLSFDELFARWSWTAIPGCPGRYVLRDAPADVSPQQLLACDMDLRGFHTPRARDTVFVVALDGGGLISYLRAGGGYCHTLNTVEGFARKVEQLGLPPVAGRA
jgi:hypothetical protein